MDIEKEKRGRLVHVLAGSVERSSRESMTLDRRFGTLTGLWWKRRGIGCEHSVYVVISYDLTLQLESLILAQSERWRQA